MVKDISLPVTEINSHPFWVDLQNESIRIGKRIKRSDIESITVSDYVKGSDKFSSYDRFVVELMEVIKEVNLRMDKIQQCIFMLDFYPDSESIWLPLTRGEYIEQVMELYIIHSVGLVDRVLHAVNLLYDLRLKNASKVKEKRLTRFNILRELKGSTLNSPLIDFFLTFDSIRDFRNYIVHQYGYSDDELAIVTTKDILARNDFINNPQQFFDNRQILREYQKVTKRLKKIMVEQQKDKVFLKNNVNLIFSEKSEH